MNDRFEVGPAPSEVADPHSAAWWARPQVVIAALVLWIASSFALWARPPGTPVPPNPEPVDATVSEVDLRDVTVYAVRDGVATPILLEIPSPDGASARLQAVIDGLRGALIETGDWPEALPSPKVFAVPVERDDAAVLDLPVHEARTDVDTERTLIASIERTLGEQGVERIAYLVDGVARDAWLGSIRTTSSLE